MKRALAIGLCAALAAAGARAQAPEPPSAPPLFETFKRVCADTHADYARSTADPEVRSWKAFPMGFPVIMKGVKLSQKAMRVKSFEKGVVRMFMAATGEATLGGRPARFDSCAVTGRPNDPQAMAREVQAWLGQPPTSAEKGVTTFRFHQAGGKRTPLAPGKLTEAAKALGPGEVVSIEVAPERRSTRIGYMSFKL